MVYPPTINGQRVNTLQFFGSRQYLLVFWHALGQYQPCGVALAVFEVLEVPATYGGPYAPGCGGLVYLEFFGHGLVRRMVLAPPLYDVVDGLDGFAYRLGDGRLDTLGKQTLN